MAVNLNLNNLYFPQLQPPVTNSKQELTQRLETLSIKKKELYAALNEVEAEELQIKAQLQQLPAAVPAQAQEVVKQAVEVEKLIQPHLLVETTKAVKSQDKFGEWEYYSVSLISKDGDKIEMKYPIDVNKYGEIDSIVIDDGVQKTVLKTDDLYVQRLIHYLSTNFDNFRKGINSVDKNGSYSNKYSSFDCQRLSYYLRHGKEGDYPYHFKEIEKPDYRNEAKHQPGRFYSLHGYTANFGNNGEYREKDIALHHYMCLTKDVFVSKYGKGQEGAVFTSYQQILDSYFPPKFIVGVSSEEF